MSWPGASAASGAAGPGSTALLTAALWAFAWGCTGNCATQSLLPGDAGRGRAVFAKLRCAACHSVNGEGGAKAPDLSRAVERGFSPARMAGAMWNHAPAMWAAMARDGIPQPALGEQQAADLFAYFFAAGSFEKPGDVGRGKQVFRGKRCGACHGIASPASAGVTPVPSWTALEDPVALAQQMWNHARPMRSSLAGRGMVYPRLSAQELTDLLAYLRSVSGAQGRSATFSPASADAGRELLQAKGCADCHQGARGLDARPTRYSLTDFAAALWNHPLREPHDASPISYEEMRRLVGYLFAAQFFEERGDRERGRRVFAEKKCDACHGDPSSGAPNLAGREGRMTSWDMVAALWEHGPGMQKQLKARGVPWPQFQGSQMADLTAYLHGVELKRRR